MIAWPAELHCRVMRDGLQVGSPDGRIRTAMDRGPAKSRGSARGVVQSVQCQVVGKTDALARLHRFWMEETAGGNLWFTIRDQQFDGARLTDADGDPLTDDHDEQISVSATWLARFASVPTTVHSGGRVHRVNFSLDVVVPV